MLTDLDQLPAATLELLERYGFDRTHFENLRARVASGELSAASNIVTGRVEAPESDAWELVWKRGTDEAEAAIEAGRKAIAGGEVGVIILNGGMATRFGGTVKGIVEALPGKSFLALKIQNVLKEAHEAGGTVRVYFMNSFATDEATRAHFAANKDFGLSGDELEFYTQGISLRMTPEGEILTDAAGEPSCYGPGHGDCPVFFKRAGCLDRFLDGGGRHLLVSNVDNLAARLDMLTLGMHVLSKKDVTAEVAPKWTGDKGGAPVYVDGKLWIVEGFRFPADFNQDDVPVFNTNTFTFDAHALKKDYELTDCYVEKKVGDARAVQVETLIGELTRFLPTQYLKVKRTGPESRFFPIKTQKDLEDGQEDLQAICG